MEPHLYQERFHPVIRLTNFRHAVLVAFACLAAFNDGGATVKT